MLDLSVSLTHVQSLQYLPIGGLTTVPGNPRARHVSISWTNRVFECSGLLGGSDWEWPHVSPWCAHRVITSSSCAPVRTAPWSSRCKSPELAVCSAAGAVRSSGKRGCGCRAAWLRAAAQAAAAGRGGRGEMGCGAGEQLRSGGGAASCSRSCWGKLGLQTRTGQVLGEGAVVYAAKTDSEV